MRWKIRERNRWYNTVDTNYETNMAFKEENERKEKIKRKTESKRKSRQHNSEGIIGADQPKIARCLRLEVGDARRAG